MVVARLRSKRRLRAQALQKIQHALPALALLPDGLARLGGEPHGYSLLLGAAEVLVSALVIVAMARSIRAAARAGRGVAASPAGADAGSHAHRGIDWTDVVLAGLLVTEAAVHQHETGHWKRPTLVLAAMMLALGLLHGRIAAWAAARRVLRVTDDGLSIAGRFFTRFTASWDEIASIDLDAADARVVRRDGRIRRVDLTDAMDPGEIAAAVESARERLAAHRAAASAATSAAVPAAAPAASTVAAPSTPPVADPPAATGRGSGTA